MGMSECFTNRKQGLIRVISTGLWGHATHLTSNSLIWTLYKHTKHNGHTLESTSSHKHLLTSQKQTSMRHNGVSDTDWQMFVLWGACSCHMMRSSEMQRCPLAISLRPSYTTLNTHGLRCKPSGKLPSNSNEIVSEDAQKEESLNRK